MPQIRKMLGYGEKTEAFSYLIDSILPIAESIETLAPVGNDISRPNPEYPWLEKVTNNVISPLAYEYLNFAALNTKMAKFNGFFYSLKTHFGYDKTILE